MYRKQKTSLSFCLLFAATISCIRGAALKKENVFDNFNKKVTAGNNLKTDTALMTSPFAKLQSSMRFAPVCLSILGKMNLISTEKDVNLIEIGKTNGKVPDFEHLDAPESLRASLAQLGNAAYWAFNGAHTSMNEISLRTEKVPGHLKDALKVLFTGSDGEIQTYFPVYMKRIKEVADTCVKKAESVSKSYEDVLLIAQDLSVASIRAQGLTDKEKDEVDRQKALAQIEADHNKKRKGELNARLEDAKKKMDERNEAFKKAQDSLLPNEWEKFGMELFKSLPGMFTDIGAQLALPAKKRNWGEFAVNALSKGLSNGFQSYDEELKKFFEDKPEEEKDQKGKGREPRVEPGNLENLETTFATRDVVTEIQKLDSTVDTVKNFFNSDGTLDTEALSKKADEVLSQLDASKDKINTKIENGARKKFSNKAIGFMENLKKIVEDLKKVANSPDANGKKGESEYIKFLDLKKKIKAMIKSDVAILEKELPFLKKSPKSPKDDDLSDREALSDATYALQLAERKLKDAEREMDLLAAEEKQLSKTILDTMKNLQNYKIESKQLYQQLQILSEGIKAVAALQKEWDNLVRYFQDFALRVDVLLGTPLNTFVDLAKANYENELYKDVANRVSKEQLYQLAYSTSISAHNIHHEAAAYVELSDKHFMPVVSELTELIALDRDNDKAEIKRRDAKIQKQADTMWIAINNILVERERKFDNAVEARIKELRHLFTYEIVEKLPQELKEEVPQINMEAKEDIDNAMDDFLNDL